jgi:hypothetical protein
VLFNLQIVAVSSGVAENGITKTVSKDQLLDSIPDIATSLATTMGYQADSKESLSSPITPVEADTGNLRDQIKQKLAGTKWINSNNILFEWTKDGYLIRHGIKSAWTVLGPHRIKVMIGYNHFDTLVFNDSFTEFTQLIKGGPESFSGKRAN